MTAILDRNQSIYPRGAEIFIREFHYYGEFLHIFTYSFVMNYFSFQIEVGPRRWWRSQTAVEDVQNEVQEA